MITNYPQNIHEKKFWTHKIPTLENIGLIIHPWGNIWTHEIPMRSNFGLTKYPREKLLDRRNTHKIVKNKKIIKSQNLLETDFVISKLKLMLKSGSITLYPKETNSYSCKWGKYIMSNQWIWNIYFINRKFRSIHPEVFCKEDVLKYSAKLSFTSPTLLKTESSTGVSLWILRYF